MCMVDDADGQCSVWQESHRIARKGHRCQECGRKIAVGERYWYIFIVYDGDGSGNKICAHCEIACDWLRANCGGFVMTMIADDIREHVAEYVNGPLARLSIQMGHFWRYQYGPKAGQLRPIPTLPPPIKEGAARG